MENASKALIIAGAILISILLITVGIMIFNSSSGLFNTAKSSMSDQEKNMFNQKFTMYEGTKATAAEVKELIRAINSNNADAANPQITINDKAMPTGGYSITTITPASGNVITIQNAVQYTIECETPDGVVSNIKIST